MRVHGRSCRATSLALIQEGCDGAGELVAVGLHNGSLHIYDARATASKSGLVCSLKRLYSHALHNPRITQEWSVSSLLGHTLNTPETAELESLLGAPAVTHLQLSPNASRLASMDATGVLSVFDLRKLGIVVSWCVRIFTSRAWLYLACPRPRLTTALTGCGRTCPDCVMFSRIVCGAMQAYGTGESI